MFLYLSASCYAALFAQQKPQTKLLKTGKIDEAFNVTENKTNFIAGIFSLK